MNWLISENSTVYDYAGSFELTGYVELSKETHQFAVGDTVYIYCDRPLMTIRYKCEVKHNMRLVLVDQIDNIDLDLVLLIEKGLKAAPLVPQMLTGKLLEYIEEHAKESDLNYLYPDVIRKELEIHEAIKRRFVTKQFETSPMARKKCLDHHGMSCVVCGMNFEEKYGYFGKDLIHVHHTIPLNEVADNYVITYKSDLVPVCPNCHALLHKKIDGVELTVEALRKMISA